MKLFTPKMLAKACGIPDPLASNFCTALEKIGWIQHVGTQRTASGKGKGTRVFSVTEEKDPHDFYIFLQEDVSQNRENLTGPNAVIVLFADAEDEEDKEEPDLTENNIDPDEDRTP